MPQQRKGARQRGSIRWRRLGDTDYAIAERATMETGDRSDLPYYVAVTIENTAGVPECVELTVTRRPGGPAVTADGIRKLPVRRLTQWAAESLVGQLVDPRRGVAGGVTFIRDADATGSIAEASDREQRSGRRRITDDDLRHLAELCRRADALGTSYIRLAELEMGITHDQARQWKRKAIKAGFYSPPSARTTTTKEDR